MKIVGIIPARMAASRFPNKPLKKILGEPMILHVYKRAIKSKCDKIYISSCDQEIKEFCKLKKIPFIKTSKKHTRALDRVAEAANILRLQNKDIVLCIQGDEPMLTPKMINILIEPIKSKIAVATMLGIIINSEDMWRNRDILKIIHNKKKEILYTSRSPIPYIGNFSKELKIPRIGGIFAFIKKNLIDFTNFKETYLEKIESCDSNRILDMDFCQHVVLHPAGNYFSVDTKADLVKVENEFKKNNNHKKYL